MRTRQGAMSTEGQFRRGGEPTQVIAVGGVSDEAGGRHAELAGQRLHPCDSAWCAEPADGSRVAGERGSREGVNDGDRVVHVYVVSRTRRWLNAARGAYRAATISPYPSFIPIRSVCMSVTVIQEHIEIADSPSGP